ncbi:recombinase family protein [Poritiphilus flavus]|uniref:Recombinase domain-containing protein n=1 Tax=Poritiphilus flavus TaxID=2697053 RepID=A0A6L9EBX4_9FLAO|nr:recombinase family protein [Poritiphilus flavus]NAS12234.1 hypothetical protein [Poritiphilus flavus]
MGSPQNLTLEGRLKGAERNKTKALKNENNTKAKAYIEAIQNEDLSLRLMAKKLNDAGFKTSTGKQFQATKVKRMLNN